MATKQQTLSFEIDTNNPFEQALNAAKIMQNIQDIDDACITRKFKSTQDPIKYAFDAIENVPLSELAVDFVKETFSDVFEFITGVCK